MMPIIPHLSSELIESLNLSENLIWPNYEKKFLYEEIKKIVIQINGKKRAIIETKDNLNEENLMKLILQDSNLKKHLSNKEVKRKIFIPNKLINIIL